MGTPLKPRKEQVAKLYTSLRTLNTYLYPIVINFQKDILMTIGHRIINGTTDALLNFKTAYETENLEQRFNNIKIFKRSIDDIDLLCRMLFELKYISSKQISVIVRYIAEIMIQIESWSVSTSNKLKGSKKCHETMVDVQGCPNAKH